MSWIQAVELEELEKKGSMVFRAGKRQIALWKLNGHIYALNNRCPHEGYPLQEGTVNVKDCVLTCNWHNWKFNLKTGENLLGEDSAESYRTRITDGKVFIEFPEIPRDEVEQKILVDLKVAFEKQQYGRMARELARFHFQGVEPLSAFRKAIEWSHDRLEYGMDHAYGVSADWLSLYSELEKIEDRLVCILESIDYMSETALRQPVFSYAPGCIEYSHVQFLSAVEQEDEQSAMRMIRGALASGMHFQDLEKTLTKAALMHYSDFGHSLIYVTKVGILLNLLGPEMESFLLPPLVRSICLAYREDLLREFYIYSGLLNQWSWNFGSQGTALDPDELFGKSTEFCLNWILRASRNHSAEEIYAALIHANARSLLHYDMQYQFSDHQPVSKNIGWLDFTHGLTFANAVRTQCSRYPELWKPGLLQMGCFLGRNCTFLDSSIVEQDWMVADHETFFQNTLNRLLDHGKGLPIFAAHYVKTFLAVKKEIPHVDETCGRFLVASFNRYLNSPLKEKHIRRTVRQSLSLVGKDFAGDGEISSR